MPLLQGGRSELPLVIARAASGDAWQQTRGRGIRCVIAALPASISVARERVLRAAEVLDVRDLVTVWDWLPVVVRRD